MANILSDSKLEELYTDPKYRGSFAGSSTFYDSIKKDFQAKNKYDNVVKLLSSIPTYIYHTRQFKHHETRHLQYVPEETGMSVVPGTGISFMGDLAEMPESKGYRYFLILVDLFDNYLYTSPLKNKEASTVGKAILDIKKQFDLTLSALSTDKGSEFKANKALFKKSGIALFFLTGRHKAFQVCSFVVSPLFLLLLYKPFLSFLFRQSATFRWLKEGFIDT